MNKWYIGGAVLIGILFIGGGWLFQDEGTTPSQPSGYVAPTQAQPAPAPAKSGGDANF